MPVNTIRIALVGQPNVGKSMLINSVSKSKLKVGNFSGVTVEKKEIFFKYKNYKIEITDLPGTYSLKNYSLEERVVKDFLEKNEYDIILNVVDSTNLQRNFLLTTELLNLDKNMIIALNMSDEAKKENILIDDKKLAYLLNTPCIKTSASKKEGVNELLEQIISSFENKKVKTTQFFTKSSSTDADELLNQRFNFVNSLIKECVITKPIEKKTVSEKIDSILMHKYFGLPIFLFFMWGLFQLTFTLGEIPMNLIESFFTLLIDGTKSLLGEGQLSSMIADGAIAGVGSVIMFLPNIVILFLGIALLETTGYMSRVAFLLDGFLHKFGLHGKSFIPLVTGFGCSVPAYMAARTLKNEKDRLLTLFIIGFMSCGARLPIYVLFVSAFFDESHAGNILFLIYTTGALIGLFAAKILKIFVFKNIDEPFVMEMPKYRLPSFRLITRTVINQAKMYLKKAGTFILAASLLIWFASNYPKHLDIEEQFNQKIENSISENEKRTLTNELSLYNLENSYLGYLGKFSEPFFAPLGMDWRMSVALETGLAAKEVVISTLAILYGLGEENDETSTSLLEKIRSNIPIASAISFIVFIMIYLPCLAASAVFTREAGGFKYLIYLFIFTTSTAWILSFIAYNVVKVVIG